MLDFITKTLKLLNEYSNLFSAVAAGAGIYISYKVASYQKQKDREDGPLVIASAEVNPAVYHNYYRISLVNSGPRPLMVQELRAYHASGELAGIDFLRADGQKEGRESQLKRMFSVLPFSALRFDTGASVDTSSVRLEFEFYSGKKLSVTITRENEGPYPITDLMGR